MPRLDVDRDGDEGIRQRNTSPLSHVELRHFESLLLERRADSADELRMLAAALHDVREARSEGVADDEHDPDGPTLSVEWSRISGLHSEIAAKTAAIDAALDRIASASYGSCAHCARPIGRDRLEARPAAALCIDCARAVETSR